MRLILHFKLNYSYCCYSFNLFFALVCADLKFNMEIGEFGFFFCRWIHGELKNGDKIQCIELEFFFVCLVI